MTRSEIFVASKEQALEIHEMDKSGELPGDIVRVSGLSVVRDKFKGRISIMESDMQSIDLNELKLALAKNWVDGEEVADKILEKLERKKGEYQNNKSRDKKETLWSDWGAENLDEKAQEKTPLS